MDWLRKQTVKSSGRRGFLLSFVLGFVVRMVPEILSYPYPIGFDTIHYAAMIKRGIVWQGWTSVFSMWLLDAVLISIFEVTHVDPFVLLKLTAPILYALNACGVYYFARRALGWSVGKALVASLFFAFQLASLRLSWDLYRNVLGLAILLFSLPLVRKIETRRGFVLFALLSMLVVFVHSLVSFVLLTVVFGVMVMDLMDGRRFRAVRVLSAVLPALMIFMVSTSLLPVRSDMPANVVKAYEEPSRPGGLFFLVNYLGVSGPVHDYPGYSDLVLKVLSLFGVLYLWWFPLVFVGFFRDKSLDSWTFVLFVSSFSALITPFCALDFWHRWMFMLVYPFTFYAVNGIDKVFNSGSKGIVPDVGWLRWMRISRRGMLVMFSLTVVLGSIFMAVPPFFDRFGVFLIPTTISYFPSTMLYNTVPLRDVKSVVNAMKWLNNSMGDDSGVLMHYAFFRWADLYLDRKYTIVYFVNDVDGALSVASERGFNPIYFVWWNEDFLSWQNKSVGWYGLIPPKSFISVFSADRISVFVYSGSIKLIGK
jgi:hypothetical protein